MNKKLVIGGIAAAAAVAIAVASVADVEKQEPLQEATSRTEKIKVLASFLPYYEFTRNVAGDSALVEQFTPAGVPAHDWEPQPSKIRALQDAGAFVYNGLGIEPYMESIMNTDEFDHIVFVKASENIDLLVVEGGSSELRKDVAAVMGEFESGNASPVEAIELIGGILGEHGESGHEEHALGEQVSDERYGKTIEGILHRVEGGEIDPAAGLDEIRGAVSGREEPAADPHIWLDPVLAKQQVNSIRDGLASADPDNAEHYGRNAAAYNAKLDELDESIKSRLSGCQKDTFVPFHNAFAYFAGRYGLTASALGGLSPDAEASASEIAEFVNFVAENDIRVIFAEERIDPRLAEVIADEAGAQVMVLSTIEALTPQEAVDGITFLDKMEQNLEALAVALECS